MPVKMIALWVLVVLLAGVLYVLFRSEMAGEDGKQTGFLVPALHSSDMS